MKLLSAFLLSAALLSGGASAVAQTAPAATAAPSVCTSYDGRREARDAKRVAAAEQAMARGGYPALSRQVKALREVMAHAPADFEAQQSCKMQAALMQGLAAAVRQSGRNKTVSIDAGVLSSPYPQASLLLGAHAVHNRDYAQAAEVLTRGLRMQPENPYPASEAAVALVQLGRREEALAILTRALSSEGTDARNRARLHRTRGFTLIELGRLNDAEQAYRQSLEAEPGHPGAAAQLTYIAGLKAGGAAVAPSISTSEEFARPKPDPVRP